MSNSRFQFKSRPLGITELVDEEKEIARKMLFSRVELVEMGDDVIPDRKLYMPRAGIDARLLEGVFGIQGPSKGSWTEEMFDDFFQEHLDGSCDLWLDPVPTRTPEPLFRSFYSPEHRDWLYVYASDLGMRPCGIMRTDGRLAIYSNLDCDFTFVFGDTSLVEEFDVAFGGRIKICEEFNKFLETNSADLGEGDIYGFMKLYLPKIGGCAE